ncbi:MAG: helix-turn-helix transcriptional regulator, partial [Oscillospiraceae bacterium]|nr:helix-turn-helix transcriptional regulator [Oscillospiraceae bacterium]
MSDDKYKAIFSKNLKYYMGKNRKTQSDLIKDLNLNRSSISSWVNGTRLPRMDKVDKLAKYFGIKRSDL